MKRIVLLAFACVVMDLSPAHAQGYEGVGATDPDASSRPSTISAMLYLPWYWGFGIGVIGRYELPILPQGFITGANDQFSLEPSLGFAYSSYAYSSSFDYSFVHLTPALYGVWSYFVSEKMRIYGGLGLGYSIAFYSGDSSAVSLSYFFWDVVIGLFYDLSPAIALRAELGYQGPKVGLAFKF